MPPRTDSHVTLTLDHFLAPLGLPDDPRIQPRARRELFVAIIEYLDERGLIEGIGHAPTRDLTRLDLLIPGTPIHVALSAVTDRELRELVTLSTSFGLALHLDKEGITLSGLLALKHMVSRLHGEYGERSVVEVVAHLGKATVDDILAAMHGESCRHPGAGCRYARDGLCQIGVEALESTLSALAARGVLRRRTTVQPVVWSVVV
jgi:hypothetical protein